MSEINQIFPGVNMLPPGTRLLNRSDMMDAQGVLMTRPASWWMERSRPEKMLFGHTYGLYLFPTTELIKELHTIIDGRDAIEIGAGNGCISRSLAIPGTDSYQQNDPAIAKLYAAHGQPTVNYGPHVEKLEASLAVAKYQPKVVIASWVTHMYEPQRHDLGGNVFGVNEHDVLASVDEYIFIGNTEVHKTKPLFEDLHCGRIFTHRVTDYLMGSNMLQSRSSRGLDFMLRLTRI